MKRCTKGRGLPARIILFLFAAALAGGASAQESKPVQSGAEEEVTVVLAEIQVLVTDKAGRPVTDLQPDEVEVREQGKSRPLAYVEPFATADLAPGSTRITGEAPSGSRGITEPPSGEALFLAPPAVRRIALLFDAFNSRPQDRTRWIEAARRWAETEMRADDRVSLAVVERHGIRVVVPFTSRKEQLLQYLQSATIVSGELYHDHMLDIRSLLDDLKTCVPAYEPDMCSLSTVQSYLHQWRTRSERTLDMLRRYAASLAAIPGRKVVLYMSDGLVLNPGEMATMAVMATFGTDTIAYNRTLTAFATDTYHQMVDALRVASTADVTFFTFDTRRSSLRDESWMAEERVKLHERMVADPFATMFDATRASLDTIAVETGGRSFHGPDIERNLPRAVRAMEGLYTIGFYRDALAPEDVRTRVRIRRKGVQVNYPKRPYVRRPPLELVMELAVAAPRPDGESYLVPLLAQAPLDQLPFEKGEDGAYATEVALYAEALTPDGRRPADAFEVVELQLNEAQYRARQGKRLTHAFGLVLDPGVYRFRVRLSDPGFRRMGERIMDVTLTPDGKIHAGIQDSATIQENESGRTDPTRGSGVSH